MKKLFFIFISILSLVFVFNVKAAEAVPVYMISKDGCGNCTNALNYFNELSKEEPGLLELHNFEVFNSKWEFNSNDLQSFYNAVIKHLGENPDEYATPVIIIGDYYKVGFPRNTDELYEAIKSYTEKNKKDEIKAIADKLKINIKDIESNIDVNKSQETVIEEEKPETKQSSDGLIIIAITLVLVVGFAGLIIASRK